MANEVAKQNVFGGAVSVVKATDLAKKINESAQNDPRGGSGDSLFLNFSGKKGVYTIGQDGRKISDDEQWVVNIASFEDGWVCWKGGRPQATRMSNIFTGIPVAAPNPDEFGPFDSNKGEGWFQAKGMVLKSLETDEQGYFKINSKSGVSAFAGLQRDIAERSAAGMASWPIVRLGSETFESQGYKNDKPVFHVDGWLDDDSMVVLAQDPDADIDELIAASEGGTPEVEDKTEEEPEQEPETKGKSRRARRSL